MENSELRPNSKLNYVYEILNKHTRTQTSTSEQLHSMKTKMGK
jgi:hypothetical protein